MPRTLRALRLPPLAGLLAGLCCVGPIQAQTTPKPHLAAVGPVVVERDARQFRLSVSNGRVLRREGDPAVCEALVTIEPASLLASLARVGPTTARRHLLVQSGDVMLDLSDGKGRTNALSVGLVLRRRTRLATDPFGSLALLVGSTPFGPTPSAVPRLWVHPTGRTDSDALPRGLADLLWISQTNATLAPNPFRNLAYAETDTSPTLRLLATPADPIDPGPFPTDLPARLKSLRQELEGLESRVHGLESRLDILPDVRAPSGPRR